MNENCESKSGIENINSVKIQELDKRLQLQVEASRVAVALAANDLKSRLDAMNEFRAALKDQATNFVPRAELEHNFENLAKDIKNLELSKALIEGKASQQSMNITWVISGLSLLISIVTILKNFLK